MLGVHIYIMVIVALVARITLGVSADLRKTYSDEGHELIDDISYGEHLSQHLQNEHRVVRSLSGPRKNCDSWSPWINENHPNETTDKGDHEFIPDSKLHDFCPVGNIEKIQCKDPHGEPFTKNFIPDDHTYNVTLNTQGVGVTCVVLDPISECPDISISYYCKCPDQSAMSAMTANPITNPVNPVPAETQSTEAQTQSKTNTDASMNSASVLPTGVSLKSSSTASTVSPVSSDVQGDGKSTGDPTFDIGGLSIPWWAFVVLVSGLLSIINACISIYLYRKGINNRSQKRARRTIHPLDSV